MYQLASAGSCRAYPLNDLKGQQRLLASRRQLLKPPPIVADNPLRYMITETAVILGGRRYYLTTPVL